MPNAVYVTAGIYLTENIYCLELLACMNIYILSHDSVPQPIKTRSSVIPYTHTHPLTRKLFVHWKEKMSFFPPFIHCDNDRVEL